MPLTEQTLEQWQTILDLNLNSTVLCTREFGKAMLELTARGPVFENGSKVSTDEIVGYSQAYDQRSAKSNANRE